MATPVNTLATGGLPVVDVTATTPKLGVPVSEATPGRGIAVTKVTNLGLPVTFDVAPVSYSALDQATATAVTLSGGGLVATNTGTTSANQGARVASASAKTSSKYYFEATLTDATIGVNGGFGIATTASTYTSMGSAANTGINWFWNGGNIWVNGGNSGLGTGLVLDGYIIGCAIDLDNRKGWYRIAPSGNWNSNATYNPATNVGGVPLPAGTMAPIITFGGTNGAPGAIITMNFGASAFSGAVPSGFTSGWPA